MQTKDAKHHQELIRLERRRIRWYWVGVVLYSLIWLNGLRFARQVSYVVLILGALVNVAMLLGAIFLLRRSNLRLRALSDPGTSQ